jgi:hypothetical protein
LFELAADYGATADGVALAARSWFDISVVRVMLKT